MNKIICNSIDFVFAYEVETMFFDQVNLNPGAVWRKLESTEKPVYRSETKQADPGPIREESVTTQTRFDSEAILKTYAAYPVILRMKTDQETFYVGNQQYPVMAEVSDDRIFDNYSFKRKSEP